MLSVFEVLAKLRELSPAKFKVIVYVLALILVKVILIKPLLFVVPW